MTSSAAQAVSPTVVNTRVLRSPHHAAWLRPLTTTATAEPLDVNNSLAITTFCSDADLQNDG